MRKSLLYGLVDDVPRNLYDSTEQKLSLKVSGRVTEKSRAIGVGEFIQMKYWKPAWR